MTLPTQELRKAAEKASEGEEWIYDGCNFVLTATQNLMVCEPRGYGRNKVDDFGNFIALANPQAVIQLLDERDEAILLLSLWQTDLAESADHNSRLDAFLAKAKEDSHA